MKSLLFTLVLAFLLASCATAPGPQQLVHSDLHVSGGYERLYTRGALLDPDTALPDVRDYLFFLLDEDEQGMLLISATRAIDPVRRIQLTIDGEELPLLAQEQYAETSAQAHKQGLFMAVSRELLQKIAAARNARLSIERSSNYRVEIANDVKDRLSLLLVQGQMVDQREQWAMATLPMTATVHVWLRGLVITTLGRQSPKIDSGLWHPELEASNPI